MILAYIIPLLLLLAFFIFTFFMIEWLAKSILIALIIIITLLPFLLLYKAEGKDEK